MASHTNIHPEDVKALIRKRFGSLQAFERARGLPFRSVSDLLRGKTSQRVAAAVNKEISARRQGSASKGKVSTKADSSALAMPAQRPNDKAA